MLLYIIILFKVWLGNKRKCEKVNDRWKMFVHEAQNQREETGNGCGKVSSESTVRWSETSGSHG